jgi:hypothetical protein
MLLSPQLGLQLVEVNHYSFLAILTEYFAVTTLGDCFRLKDFFATA